MTESTTKAPAKPQTAAAVLDPRIAELEAQLVKQGEDHVRDIAARNETNVALQTQLEAMAAVRDQVMNQRDAALSKIAALEHEHGVVQEKFRGMQSILQRGAELATVGRIDHDFVNQVNALLAK